jgi:hypothetical protein
MPWPLDLPPLLLVVAGAPILHHRMSIFALFALHDILVFPLFRDRVDVLFLAALRFEEENLFPHCQLVSLSSRMMSCLILWRCPMLALSLWRSNEPDVMVLGVVEEGAMEVVPMGSYFSILSG